MVEAIRKIKDSKLFVTGGGIFYWDKIAPLKVSCFIWRAMAGRILVADELLKRWFQIPSNICHLCNNELEMVDHVLIRCPFAVTALE